MRSTTPNQGVGSRTQALLRASRSSRGGTVSNARCAESDGRELELHGREGDAEVPHVTEAWSLELPHVETWESKPQRLRGCVSNQQAGGYASGALAQQSRLPGWQEGL